MKKTKIVDFDPAQLLDNEKTINAFLSHALESGDPEYIKAAIAAVARPQNMSELSRRAGISRQAIYGALAPNSRPEFATIYKIVRALGYNLTISA